MLLKSGIEIGCENTIELVTQMEYDVADCKISVFFFRSWHKS